MTAAALTLYAVSAVLELAGLICAGIDLTAAGRRARAYQALPRKMAVAFRDQIISFQWEAAIELRDAEGKAVMAPKPTTAQRLARLEAAVAGLPDRLTEAIRGYDDRVQGDIAKGDKTTDDFAREREQQIVELVGALKASRLGWLGFALLLTGVLVGTAGNFVGQLA